MFVRVAPRELEETSLEAAVPPVPAELGTTVSLMFSFSCIANPTKLCNTFGRSYGFITFLVVAMVHVCVVGWETVSSKKVSGKPKDDGWTTAGSRSGSSRGTLSRYVYNFVKTDDTEKEERSIDDFVAGAHSYLGYRSNSGAVPGLASQSSFAALMDDGKKKKKKDKEKDEKKERKVRGRRILTVSASCVN